MIDRPWPSIDALRAAEASYRRTWWTADRAVQAACANDPGLSDRLRSISTPRTVDVFRHAGGYTDERLATHKQILAEQIGTGSAPAAPTAYFTIGCMGSGKTTLLRRFVDAHRRVVSAATSESLSRVAADNVRESLPGYDEGLGSRVVAPECFDVTYPNVFEAARDAGFDLVYDTIGTIVDGEVVLRPNLEDLRNCGFSIQLLRAHAPLDVCVRRAARRALETGRLVEADDQALLFHQPEEVERRLREAGLLHGWISIDTSGDEHRLPILEASDDWRDVFGQLEQIVRDGR